MRKKILGVGIALCLVFSLSVVSYAFDYEIGDAWIQHRTFEKGPSINKLVIGMIHSGSSPPDYTDTNVVDSVEVFDSSNNEVTLGDGTLFELEAKYPGFNCGTRQWNYITGVIK